MAGQRLADAELLLAVARSGDEQSARTAIEAASSLHDTSVAYTIIAAGLERPTLASGAVFALAQTMPHNNAAATHLFALLGDRDLGGSAAAALAQNKDANLVQTIADQLEQEADTLTATRLALALRLMDNPAAKERLRQFMLTPGAHKQLKASLQEAAQ